MTVALPWLPLDALASRQAAAPFRQMVEDWSERWFPQDAGWKAAPAFQPLRGEQWSTLRHKDSLELVGKPKATLELAFALLGEQPRDDLTPTDLRLLRQLATRALEDLGTRIDDSLPPAAVATGERATWYLAIGPVDESRLAVACGEAALAAMARTSFPPIQKKRELCDFRMAVENLDISATGRLGTACLSVEQIEALTIGDILVLDEPADAPIELLVDGRSSRLFFTVGESGNRLTMTMQE